MDGLSPGSAQSARTGWVSVQARRAGTAHVRRGVRCEDAIRVLHRGPTLIAALADGAGSAVRGGAGAALAVRALTTALARGLTMAAAFEHAADRLHHAAVRSGLDARDLATTAIAIVADATGVSVGHVGDGAVVGRIGGVWTPLSWPHHGEHAGATTFLTDDDMNARVSVNECGASALAAFTDGLERLVLDLAAKTAPPAFFERIIAPVDIAAPGRNPALSQSLGRYLTAAAVTERTDDDVTLLLAARNG